MGTNFVSLSQKFNVKVSRKRAQGCSWLPKQLLAVPLVRGPCLDMLFSWSKDFLTCKFHVFLIPFDALLFSFHLTHFSSHSIWRTYLLIPFDAFLFSFHLTHFSSHSIWRTSLLIPFDAILFSFHLTHFSSHFIWRTSLLIPFDALLIPLFHSSFSPFFFSLLSQLSLGPSPGPGIRAQPARGSLSLWEQKLGVERKVGAKTNFSAETHGGRG